MAADQLDCFIGIVTLIVIPRVALGGGYDASSGCGIHVVFAMATGIFRSDAAKTCGG